MEMARVSSNGVCTRGMGEARVIKHAMLWPSCLLRGSLLLTQRGKAKANRWGDGVFTLINSHQQAAQAPQQFPNLSSTVTVEIHVLYIPGLDNIFDDYEEA